MLRTTLASASVPYRNGGPLADRVSFGSHATANAELFAAAVHFLLRPWGWPMGFPPPGPVPSFWDRVPSTTHELGEIGYEQLFCHEVLPAIWIAIR